MYRDQLQNQCGNILKRKKIQLKSTLTTIKVHYKTLQNNDISLNARSFLQHVRGAILNDKINGFVTKQTASEDFLLRCQ